MGAANEPDNNRVNNVLFMIRSLLVSVVDVELTPVTIQSSCQEPQADDLGQPSL